MSRTAKTELIGVVGSDLSALAAACTLVGRGYQVHRCEVNQHTNVSSPEFIVLPRVLDRIFRECGLRFVDHVQLQRVHPLDAFSSSPDWHRLMRCAHGVANAVRRHWYSLTQVGHRDLIANVSPFDWASFLRSKTVQSIVERYIRDKATAELIVQLLERFGIPRTSPALACHALALAESEGVWRIEPHIDVALLELSRRMRVEVSERLPDQVVHCIQVNSIMRVNDAPAYLMMSGWAAADEFERGCVAALARRASEVKISSVACASG